MSVANFEQIGVADRPSPSIWKSCRKTLLNDLGLGTFFHAEFLGVVASATAEAETFDGMQLDGDPATVSSGILPVDINHGRLDLETDGDDNDAWALFNQVEPQFVPNSGQRVWFEARVHLGDVTMDGGMFLGFVEEDGLSRDVVADDAAALVGQSLVGFQVLTADPNAIAAVYQLDAGTTVVVAADITNNVAITDGGGTVASLVNDVYHKFGVTFDGRETVRFFVDGHDVASVVIDTTIFPNGVRMGACFGLKTGAIAAESANTDWIRWAFQERY